MFLELDQSYDSPMVANAFHGYLDIKAPIELVFRYLTGGAELSAWWASKCSSVTQPGGEIQFTWDGEVSRSGRAVFRRFEPPTTVVMEWTHANEHPIMRDGSDPRGICWRPLTIWELAILARDQTRLSLIDRGVQAGEKYAGYRQAAEDGWRDALLRLKRVVETRHAQNLECDRRRKLLEESAAAELR